MKNATFLYEQATRDASALAGTVDALRKENYALRQALQDLYDASPASPDSDSLCQAQLAAEKVLGL